MTDIATLKPVEDTFEVLHPVTEEPIGIRVTTMSPDDERMKIAKREIQNFNLQKQKRNKTLKAVEIEDNETKLLSATVTGWEWYGEDVSFEGSKPEFNIKNVKKVLTSISWFRDQLNEHLDNTKGFFST